MSVKTLYVVAKGQIDWIEKERQELAPNEVRIKNRYGTEKHGTMQAIIKGYGSRRGKWDEDLGLYFGTGVAWDYPLYLGNMNLGEVIEVGAEVTHVKPGQTVCASGPFQAESVTSESECFLVPPGLDWKTAFLQDPGEFALGAIRDGNLRMGDHVAIFSLGAIGLTAVQMAVAAGADRVVAVDPLASRREAARECGAHVVLGEDPEDIGWQIRQNTRKHGIDVAIDFSGAVPAMQAAFRALAPMGTLVLGAYPDETTATLDFGRESHANQLNIAFTRACSHPLRDHPRWDWHRIREATWSAICQGKMNGAPIVDDPIPFEEVREHYARIAEAPHETIKMSVVYPE